MLHSAHTFKRSDDAYGCRQTWWACILCVVCTGREFACHLPHPKCIQQQISTLSTFPYFNEICYTLHIHSRGQTMPMDVAKHGGLVFCALYVLGANSHAIYRTQNAYTSRFQPCPLFHILMKYVTLCTYIQEVRRCLWMSPNMVGLYFVRCMYWARIRMPFTAPKMHTPADFNL